MGDTIAILTVEVDIRFPSSAMPTTTPAIFLAAALGFAAIPAYACISDEEQVCGTQAACAQMFRDVEPLAPPPHAKELLRAVEPDLRSAPWIWYPEGRHGLSICYQVPTPKGAPCNFPRVISFDRDANGRLIISEAGPPLCIKAPPKPSNP